MLLKEWSHLPEDLRNNSVKKYYNVLKRKNKYLLVKRLLDLLLAVATLIVLMPVFIIISIAIKIDSKGPIFYRQTRVTQYGKFFPIYKFRTMVHHTNKIGSAITIKDDHRITYIGRMLRQYRLDEIPQLFNIITGDMTFVGTRPEIVQYVEHYTKEMKATLLLPAGVTSEASIRFKDEEKLLLNAKGVDDVYTNKVLPEKMRYNLKSLKETGFLNDLKVIVMTITNVCKTYRN